MCITVELTVQIVLLMWPLNMNAVDSRDGKLFTFNKNCQNGDFSFNVLKKPMIILPENFTKYFEQL